MELRLFIPDTPRRAWQVLCYWFGIRKSPVRIYGIEDMRREHHMAVRLASKLRETEDKLNWQRNLLIDANKEITMLKRGMGTGRGQPRFAKPTVPGSTPAHASTAEH